MAAAAVDTEWERHPVWLHHAILRHFCSALPLPGKTLCEVSAAHGLSESSKPCSLKANSSRVIFQGFLKCPPRASVLDSRTLEFHRWCKQGKWRKCFRFHLRERKWFQKTLIVQALFLWIISKFANFPTVRSMKVFFFYQFVTRYRTYNVSQLFS